MNLVRIDVAPYINRGKANWTASTFLNVDAVDCKLTLSNKPRTFSRVYIISAFHIFYFPHFHVLHFPHLLYCAAFSCLAYSCLALSASPATSLPMRAAENIFIWKLADHSAS